jgi:hypothetical protein
VARRGYSAVKDTGPTPLELQIAWMAIAGSAFSLLASMGHMHFDMRYFDGVETQSLADAHELAPETRFQVGQHCRTRDGRKAFIGCIGGRVDVGDKCIGWIGSTLCSWTEDGFYLEDLVPHEKDLVAAWDGDDPQ